MLIKVVLITQYECIKICQRNIAVYSAVQLIVTNTYNNNKITSIAYLKLAATVAMKLIKAKNIHVT